MVSRSLLLKIRKQKHMTLHKLTIPRHPEWQVCHLRLFADATNEQLNRLQARRSLENVCSTIARDLSLSTKSLANREIDGDYIVVIKMAFAMFAMVKGEMSGDFTD